jgi:hypothetical protein
VSSQLRFVATGVLLGLSLVTPPHATGNPTAAGEISRSPQAKPEVKPQAGVEEAERVKREVGVFLEHYIRTLESRDERAIRVLFVDDGRFAWFTDGVRMYSTPDQVIAGMRLYEGVRFQTSLSEVRVLRLAAGLASAQSLFATKLTIPGSSDAAFGGVITWLVEQDPTSGDWKVLQGHTSTPGGPPTDSGSRGQR